MTYVPVTKYYCPRCKATLPYSKLFLSSGMSVIRCPNCGTSAIVERNVKCRLCSRSATHVNMSERLEGNMSDSVIACTPTFSCDLHIDCDDIKESESGHFKCVSCGTRTQYKNASVTIENGIVRAVCPTCGAVCCVRENVKCDGFVSSGTQCRNVATHVIHHKHSGFINALRAICDMPHGFEFYCDEHFKRK